MQRKFMQNGVEIGYTLEFKSVKNLNLRVRRDGSVYVSVPRKTPIKSVESFISANFDGIIAAQKKFAEIAEKEEKQSPQSISDGSIIRIFGEEVTVKIETAPKVGAEFSESERLVWIFLPEITPYSAESVYNAWKKEYCLEIFAGIIAELHPKFAQYGVPTPTLRVREMKTRWGSCIPSKGVVTLNTRLLAYPKDCIEYVAVHELCHFKEANHSARFYGWMDKMLPDWRERKMRLREGK